ncbi:hypothetical protein [Aestuariivivens sediminis]|uniref:hypothetical protein n=1 Tax=Aestuariivivens sediminis TaxID=2913557 RepID=UPI001F563127|nr:hypothetical protein [Aestuariivivens sediminis]
MKKSTKIILLLFVVFGVSGTISGQQEKGIVGIDNWLNNWTQFRPNQEYYGEPTQILTGRITEDTKLHKRYTYLLLGSVFVANQATLTIEPGTVIIGDYKTNGSLTIAKGSKIMAKGLETDPIIFTSSKSVKRAGDWGGIMILGDAPTNKFGNGSVSAYLEQLDPANYGNTNYGGDNIEASSGILRYVRIEYAGKRTKSAGYFNGLLLAGVGKKTEISHVMVSFAAGDAFKVLGGAVSIDRAVSYKSNGNDFKFNYGAQCELTNSLAVRSPYISSSEGSRCVKVMSYEEPGEVDLSKKGTSLTAKNLTLLNDSEDLKNDISMGLVRAGVYVGHFTSLDMEKTVISGFNPAVIFDSKVHINQENLEKIKFSEMYFNNCNGNIFVENNANNDDLENWYGNSAFFNVYSKSPNAETFIDIRNERRPDFRLKINKIIATNNDPDLIDD